MPVVLSGNLLQYHQGFKCWGMPELHPWLYKRCWQLKLLAVWARVLQQQSRLAAMHSMPSRNVLSIPWTYLCVQLFDSSDGVLCCCWLDDLPPVPGGNI